MIVKVKYEETVSREAMVEVDEEEFMVYANDGDVHSYATPAEAIAAEPVDLQYGGLTPLKDLKADNPPYPYAEEAP